MPKTPHASRGWSWSDTRFLPLATGPADPAEPAAAPGGKAQQSYTPGLSRGQSRAGVPVTRIVARYRLPSDTGPKGTGTGSDGAGLSWTGSRSAVRSAPNRPASLAERSSSAETTATCWGWVAGWVAGWVIAGRPFATSKPHAGGALTVAWSGGGCTSEAAESRGVNGLAGAGTRVRSAR